MTSHAGIYCRVSTGKQVERYSLPTQEKMLRDYAQEHGFEVVKVYADEGVSAKDLDRPKLKELLNDVQRGVITAVLVLETDRLLRSVEDLFTLHRFLYAHHCELIAILEPYADMTTSDGRFQKTIRTASAEYERRHAADRVRRNMKHRAQDGQFNGGLPPFGYLSQRTYKRRLQRDGKTEAEAMQEAVKRFPEHGKLYVFPEEADVVQRMFTAFLHLKSVRKTAAILNGLGIPPRIGTRWGASVVHGILTNPAYVGTLRWGTRRIDPISHKRTPQSRDCWIEAHGRHEPIVTQPVFDQVQSLLKTSPFKPTREKRVYLLSGLVRCGLCGAAMVGNSAKRGIHEYAYYKCRVRAEYNACDCPVLPAKDLEELVVARIKTLAQDTTFLNDKRLMLDAVKAKQETASPSEEQERLDRHIHATRRKLDALLNAMIDAEFKDDALMRSKYQHMKEELTALEAQRTSAATRRDLYQHEYEILKASFDAIAQFGQTWDIWSDTTRRECLRQIIERVVITKGKPVIELCLDVGELSLMDFHSTQQLS